jgi:hypothetical protein
LWEVVEWWAWWRGDEFERESSAVDVVLIGYGCGLGLRASLAGDTGLGNTNGWLTLVDILNVHGPGQTAFLLVTLSASISHPGSDHPCLTTLSHSYPLHYSTSLPFVFHGPLRLEDASEAASLSSSPSISSCQVPSDLNPWRGRISKIRNSFNFQRGTSPPWFRLIFS